MDARAHATSAPPPTTRTGNFRPSTVTRLSEAVGREESETYRHVIARLNGRWRVIACRGGIQWIVQTRRGPRWHNRYFCRTRDGLLQCAREHAGQIDGIALARLLRLPQRIEAVP
jgi:hypothetical protein